MAWADILNEVQIAPHLLNTSSARITAAQMESLSALVMKRLDDEALGWFERALPWGSYGMLARASLSAPTLDVALKRWCRHHGLLTQAVTMDVFVEHDAAGIEFNPHGIAQEHLEFCTVTLLRNALGLASWIIDSRIAMQRATFAYPPPEHVGAYADLFPCEVEFLAPVTRVYFDAAYLRLPTCRQEEELRTMLQRALPLTVRHYPKDRLLVERVRRLLRTSPHMWRDAESVADALSMSARSLHRQLAAEGARWQTLKTEERMRKATSLLRYTDRGLKQIAEASGFEDVKSFSRAFKAWSLTSPNQFRREWRVEAPQIGR
ncbi:MAG: hypothetical protein RL357_1986 [Pseudomonadota bacterium]